jgi:NAD+ synthase (glutamine-hydrolysing)
MAAGHVESQAADALREIVEAEFSPELIPPHADGGIQRAEETVGPYELQDFSLYYATRFGFRPSKIAFLAEHAWSDRRRGVWPQTIPDVRRHDDLAAIKRWLPVFIDRFFAFSQFKRSAMPNAEVAPADRCRRAALARPGRRERGVWLQELRRFD